MRLRDTLNLDAGDGALLSGPPPVQTPSAYVDQRWNGRERHFDERNMDYPVEKLVGTDIVREAEIASSVVARQSLVTAVSARSYAATGIIGQTTAPPKWDANQGPIGACTAFSDLLALVWGGKHPRLLKVLLSSSGYDFGLKLYRFIQSIDREEGRWYSEGCTMNASAKALHRLGWIKGYYWDYTVTGFIAAHEAKRSVLTGIDWPEGFDDPDPEYAVVRFKGNVLGGHSIFWPYMTRNRRIAVAANTWGRAHYGTNGTAQCPLPDLARAIAQYGEVLVLDEVTDADPQALLSLGV